MAIPSELSAIARRIRAAQDEVRSIEPLTSDRPAFDVISAYEVARLVHEERQAAGAFAVGRKIGFSNPEMWERYGVREPIWGYVYDRTVTYLEAPSGAVRVGRFVEPMIEPEIVFGLQKPPVPGASLTEILGCAAWVAHGYEIVQSHYPEWRFQAADAIADGALHAALLVGEPLAVEGLGPNPLRALETFALVLSCDGAPRARGMGANVLGHPLRAIAHLAALVASHASAAPLAAGEIVTTGTITAAQPVFPGQVWTSRLTGIGLPGLTLRIEV